MEDNSDFKKPMLDFTPDSEIKEEHREPETQPVAIGMYQPEAQVPPKEMAQPRFLFVSWQVLQEVQDQRQGQQQDMCLRGPSKSEEGQLDRWRVQDVWLLRLYQGGQGS